MFPILFQIGSFTVQSYGIFLALGYLSGLLLLRKTCRDLHLDFFVVTQPCLPVFLISILGARALFVLTNLDYFRLFPAEILHIWRGGLVFYGAVITGLPALVFITHRRRLSIGATLDVFAPALAAGHAVGRLGCFAAGCCHGRYCELPWGVRFSSDLVDPVLRGLPLHPTQLYESFGLAVLAVAAYFFLLKRSLRPGGVALLYLGSYSVLRFIVEFFRGDQIRGFVFHHSISISQAIALAIFVASTWLFVLRLRRNH